MKSNPAKYMYHIEDKTVDEHCLSIQSTEAEIDDVDNQALYDILLEPAGLGLDILDLNRYNGDSIYVQSRMPERAAGNDCVIRLLYRP